MLTVTFQIALGRAMFSSNRPEQGVAALTKAARLAGEDAEAWFQIGQACVGIGRGEAAEVALRRAYANDPLHPGAAVAVAERMRIAGEEVAAETILRHLLAARPDCAPARLDLVAWLTQEDRAGEALALLDAYPPPQAFAGHWRVRRAHALIRLGDRAAAAALLAALPGPPAGAVLPYHHARMRLVGPMGEAAVALQMEASLELPSEDADMRIASHFHLGRFWLKHADAERAFSLWTRGHRRIAVQQPFSRAEYEAFVANSIRCFDQARMAGPLAANDDPAPVFIVGMPRSGTTLMEQILAAHAQVHGAGERRELARCFHVLGGAPTEAECAAVIAGLSGRELDAAGEEYLAALHALAPERARIVDKMPGNFQYLGLAALLMPRARFIHCVRDPRDIGFSIFSMRFRGSHPYAHDLADIGWYIARQQRLMAHWQAVLPGRVLRVHLFEWIHHFDATLRRVLDFLELPPDENCQRFFELDRKVRTASRFQVRVPVNADGMSRWRPYARQLAPLIKALQEEGVLRRLRVDAADRAGEEKIEQRQGSLREKEGSKKDLLF